MVKRKVRRRKQNRLVQPGKRTRGRRNGRGTFNPFGELISKGVKTLVSYIPGGSWINKMASFAWKAVTMSANDIDPALVTRLDLREIAAVATPCCLSTQFIISPSVIMAGSMNAVSTDGTIPEYTCSFAEARIRWVKVKVNMTGKLGERQGMLAIAITPFRDSGDAKMYRDNAAIQYFDRVARRPGARTGSATQTLAVTWTPKVLDGFGYQYHPLMTGICLVTISFQDTSHAAETQFAVDAINFNVTVEGELGCRQGSVTKYETFKMKVEDLLDGKRVRISTPSGDYTISDDESVLFKHDPSGSVSRVEILPSLQEMAL